MRGISEVAGRCWASGYQVLWPKEAARRVRIDLVAEQEASTTQSGAKLLFKLMKCIKVNTRRNRLSYALQRAPMSCGTVPPSFTLASRDISCFTRPKSKPPGQKGPGS